jgi:hypothetical protein
MYFNRTTKEHAIDGNLGMQKIRTVLVVPITPMVDLQFFARIRFQMLGVEGLLCPDVLQSNLFHNTKFRGESECAKSQGLHWRTLQRRNPV